MNLKNNKKKQYELSCIKLYITVVKIVATTHAAIIGLF